MAKPNLDPAITEKLAIALSGDTELFDSVANHLAKVDAAFDEEEQQRQELQNKLEDTEKLKSQYSAQIANLVSKLPMGSSARPESFEDRQQAIIDREW